MSTQAGIAGFLIAALLALPLRAEDQQSLRDDTITLMGPAVYVPGTAAYCNEAVAPNERLINAAGAWNKRHDALLRKMVRVIEATGGMSTTDREYLQRLAFKAIRSDIEGQADKPAFCDSFAVDLDAGKYDLDTGDFSDLAKHVMAADLE